MGTPPRTVVWVGLLAFLPVICLAEPREIVVDPLTAAADWQLGGRRVNYVLGDSSVGLSKEQTFGGAPAALKLVYDFTDPQRDYLSYYHLGEAVPGKCAELWFELYGDGSECRIRLSLEDARGRWFEKEAGVVDWQGWKEVRATVGEAADWRPLLRRGEARLPVLQPVNLRQIALFRGPKTPAKGAVYIQDLRAKADVVAADLVAAKLATGRPANLFDLGEAPTVQVELTNRSAEAVTGRLGATATEFFGRAEEVAVGDIELPAGGTVRKELRFKGDRLGLHQVKVTLRAGERERVWFGRFAVVKPREKPTPDPKALFGCNCALSGFSAEQMPTVLRLNCDAGIRWERLGFGWGEINPAPGVWTWDGPARGPGPVGRAVELKGQPFTLPHSPVLDCRDAVTVAFWARGTGANGAWQAVLSKWGPANERNYGVYFSLSDGQFCFSASYAKFPERGWCDVASGFSAWDREWHHYAATYSREARKVVLYVDGRVKAAQDFDGGELRTNQDDLILGNGYPGGLDELLLYGRALSAGEVAGLADKGEPPRSGLIGWWSFDETGPTLSDRSGHHLDFQTGEPSAARVARLGLDNGVKVLGLLGFPPNWASTAPKDAARPWVYKPDLGAWAAFVENTTRHYRDLVQHWEIWNEPNITTFWEPEPSAKEFLDVVRVGYEAAKRGNPNCEVLMPGLAGPGEGRWGMDFLDQLLELGAAKYCDAISIHPYRQSTPEESDLEGDLRHIAALAEKHGGKRPIWFTEDCWTTDLPWGSTEERAATMLPRCYALALGTGLMERFIWFRLHDPGVDRFYGEDNYGMCYHDLTPKPAYFAHATVAALLEGAQPEGAWEVGPGALARCFKTRAGRVAAIWAPEGEAPVSVFVGKPSARLVDMMGNETTAPTRDGVLLLTARETTTFLRDLPPGAEGRGTVAALVSPTIMRGEKGTLIVKVRNPFGRPQRAVVAVAAAAPITVASGRVEVEAPANGTKEVAFMASVPRDGEAGWHPVTVTVELAGERFVRTAKVAVRSASMDAGPVGIWKLDEGEGTVIRDSSPQGNNGTVEQPKWVEGKHGKALQFDGQHIAVIPDSPSLNLRDEVTVAFWLKLLGGAGTWQFPVAKYWQENLRRNYGIYIHKDTLSPYFSASFENGSYLHSDIGPGRPVNDGQWHHLAATYSMFDGRLRLYVDGKMEVDRAFNEGAMLLTTDPLRIGVGTTGIIDEVRLYPRALRPEEIAGVMSAE